MRDIPASETTALDSDAWSNAAEQIYRLPAASGVDAANSSTNERAGVNAPTNGDAKFTSTDDSKLADTLLAFAAPGDGAWQLPFAIRQQLSRIGEVARALGEGTEFKGFSYDGQNREEQIAALKKFKSPVDYKQLLEKGPRVALFGETHPDTEARDELINNMNDFKKLGFSHIALEALPSTRQPLIDDYYAGKATRAQVLEALKEDWGWNPESYMKLIDAAKAQGLKTLCLDVKIPQEQSDKWTKAGDYSRESRVREENWVDVMSGVLAKDLKARIIALAGKAHTGTDEDKADWLTTKLSKKGFKPTVFDLSVGEGSGFQTVFDHAVDKAGLQGERFMIPIYGRDKFRPSDYVIHLPSTAQIRRFPFLEKPQFRPDEAPLRNRLRPGA